MTTRKGGAMGNGDGGDDAGEYYDDLSTVEQLLYRALARSGIDADQLDDDARELVSENAGARLDEIEQAAVELAERLGEQG